MTLQTKRTLVHHCEATITIEDIIQAFNLPPQTKISFQVPGGGDYSNTSLSIEEYPLKAEWKE